MLGRGGGGGGRQLGATYSHPEPLLGHTQEPSAPAQHPLAMGLTTPAGGGVALTVPTVPVHSEVRPHLHDGVSQARVTQEQPPPGRDAVRLILELFWLQLVEVLKAKTTETGHGDRCCVLSKASTKSMRTL